MSKFEHDLFYDSYYDRHIYAVSKEKYSKEEAINIAKWELGCKKGYCLAIGDAFVRHRAGVDDEGQPCVGWWLEDEQHKRSCPCWMFHIEDGGYYEEKDGSYNK